MIGGGATGHPRGSVHFLCDPLCSSWLNLLVAKKKRKRKKFTATTAVKSMARTALGAPPPVQREESQKRATREKHKATLGQLLSESD
jgi:hypothetical protein